MGSPVIEGRVLAKDPPGILLVSDDEVVEAVPAGPAGPGKKQVEELTERPLWDRRVLAQSGNVRFLQS